MIGFFCAIRGHGFEYVDFAIDYLLTGVREDDVHPRNEAEAAAALRKAVTHRHFALDVDYKDYETVNLLQRAIQGSWKDMIVTIDGVRYKAKQKSVGMSFDTVTFHGVEARRSEVYEDVYRFHFNVWGYTEEYDADE
jgi:hypothetical protein